MRNNTADCFCRNTYSCFAETFTNTFMLLSQLLSVFPQVLADPFASFWTAKDCNSSHAANHQTDVGILHSNFAVLCSHFTDTENQVTPELLHCSQHFLSHVFLEPSILNALQNSQIQPYLLHCALGEATKSTWKMLIKWPRFCKWLHKQTPVQPSSRGQSETH